MDQKSDTALVYEFSLLLDTLYTVSQKNGPLLRFEITPTNCAQ